MWTIDFMIDFKIKIFFNGFDKIEINGKFIGQFSEKLVFNWKSFFHYKMRV